ncbi:MAG: hypothetical protein IT328_20185 [Caldilineaceae bacterium]|nr:hypothetical protein [Caldilineaceae bacterium]
MTISLNGITVPQSIRERGSYVYTRSSQEVVNGLGETITAGLPSVVWTFNSLPPTDYAWWVTTLLGGAAYKKCAAVLWDDKDVETSFSQVIVRYPKPPEGRKNGRYRNVQIVIDTMVAT